jgi:hypothetical protein
LGHCLVTALSEDGPVPFGDLVEKGHNGLHRLGQIQQPCKLSPVHHEACALKAEIAADQKAVALVLLHRREVKCSYVWQRAAFRHIPLPQINRALDITPLVGPFSRDDL